MARTDEETEAARAVRDPVAEARRLLERERHGVLSTLSVELAGYPYGSITPYALSRRGQPLVLISTIAAHTKNLRADPRAGLFVGEHPDAPRDAWDPQARGRISLMGRCTPVAETHGDDEERDARARYLERVPQAAGYFRTHDFVLHELAVEKVRLIGGFGRICWVDGARMGRDPAADPLAPHAAGICRHMNEDHADAVLLYCRVLRGLPEVERATMTGVDALGFDVEAGLPGGEPRRLRFSFGAELKSTDEVRRALVALVREARARDAAGGGA